MTEEQQTLTYEEPQNQEVLNEEEQDSLEVGEKMEAEQEQLLAGKYKDAKEVEKAYKELEGKLGEKSEPDSPKKESKNETKNEVSNEQDNILDELWEEGINNKLTQKTFNKLQKMNPVEVAKLAFQQRQKQQQQQPQQREFTDRDIQSIQGLVGGKENYDNMIGWANQNMSEQEVKMYDAVMDKGDPLSAYFAVQAMSLRYQDKVGKDGQLVTGKAPKQTSDVFNSQQEMVKAMEDERHNDDPAYREAILNKLERSNINF